MSQLLPLLDVIPNLRGKVGAPLRNPEVVMGDRAYHSDSHWMDLSARAMFVPNAVTRSCSSRPSLSSS